MDIPDEFRFDGRDGNPVSDADLEITLERIARAEEQEAQ